MIAQEDAAAIPRPTEDDHALLCAAQRAGATVRYCAAQDCWQLCGGSSAVFAEARTLAGLAARMRWLRQSVSSDAQQDVTP